MAKKVKHSDIIEEGLFNPSIENAKEFIKVLDEVEKEFKEVLKASSSITKQIPKTKQGIDNFAKAADQSRQAVEGLSKVEKQRERVLNQIATLETKQGRALEKSKIQLQEKRRAVKEELKAEKGLVNEYKRQSAILNKLRNDYKSLILTQGASSKQARKLGKEISILDARLKKADKSAGQFQRNVGNYPSVLGGATKALGAFGVALGAGAIVKNVVGTFRDFEQGGANLAAVLGKSRDEIKPLIEDAKRLGASTAFTASQVTELQTEFAKLGFKENEIIAATEATLDLAAASGTELAEAAAIAGATLGGFGLEANETQRVTDVMAKSFSASALDMTKFAESMKTAAPAAKAVGINVEETTALLGTLANAGISGSKAGNNLKTSLINLNKAGLNLEKGLDLVNKAQDKLGAATELVGKNAAASFLVLAEGTETTAKLTTELENAGGAAGEMAETQLDTLDGSITKLGSAWEGFILSLEDGDGVLSQILRGAIDLATEFLGWMSGASKSVESLEREQAKFNRTFNNSIEALKDSNTSLEVRERLYDEINSQYGDYLEFQIDETTNLEQLTHLQNQYNEAAKTRLELAKNQLLIEQKTAQQAELLETIVALEQGTYDQTGGLGTILGISFATDLDPEMQKVQAEILQDEYNKLQDEINDLFSAQDKFKGVQRENNDLMSRTREVTEQSGKATSKATKKTEKHRTVLEELKKELTFINKLREDELGTNGESLVFKRMTTQAEELADKIEFLEAKLKQSSELEKFGMIKPKDARDTAQIATPSGIMEDENKSISDALAERADIIEGGLMLINEIVQKNTARRIGLIDEELAALDEKEQNEAFKQKRRAELELQKQREEQRAARAELALTAAETYAGYVQNGQSGNQALTSTIKDITLLKAFVNGLDFFYEGTEDTGTAANPLDTNGGRLAVLHDNERVMTAEQNKLVSGLTNWELANVGAMYKNGTIQVDAAINNQRFNSNEQIIAKFDELKNSIDNIDAPNVTFEYDSINRMFVETVERKNSVERNHNKTNWIG